MLICLNDLFSLLLFLFVRTLSSGGSLFLWGSVWSGADYIT